MQRKDAGTIRRRPQRQPPVCRIVVREQSRRREKRPREVREGGLVVLCQIGEFDDERVILVDGRHRQWNDDRRVIDRLDGQARQTRRTGAEGVGGDDDERVESEEIGLWSQDQIEPVEEGLGVTADEGDLKGLETVIDIIHHRRDGHSQGVILIEIEVQWRDRGRIIGRVGGDCIRRDRRQVAFGAPCLIISHQSKELLV